jgi:hypothetical protein
MELPGLAIALVITPGLVQFLKDLIGFEGKPVKALSFVTGAVLVFALNAETFFPGVGQYIAFGIGVVTAGLAASGYYDIGKKFSSQV